MDAIIHLLEFVTNVDEPSDHLTTYNYNISIIKSIIECADILQRDPKNYAARANFCWAATVALDGFSAMSMKGGCWATHYFEHVLGGFDPTVSHGAGLGVAFPAFVRVNTERRLRQKTYARIARDVYGKEGAAGLIEGF